MTSEESTNKQLNDSERSMDSSNNEAMAALIIAILVLCAFTFAYGSAAIEGLASYSWPSTEGTITASRVRDHGAKGPGAFIEYEYFVDGKSEKGRTVTRCRLWFQQPTQAVDRYHVGQKVSVHYLKNGPFSPKTALEPGALPSSIFATICCLALTIGSGLSAPFILRSSPKEVAQAPIQKKQGMTITGIAIRLSFSVALGAMLIGLFFFSIGS